MKSAEEDRVLVVDDDRSLATVVADVLEQVDEGLRTTYTTDPRQALAMLDRGQIDCLVTDYEMPTLDGLALVDRDATDTPFVLFTQCRDERLADGADERGGAYLPKESGREQYRRLAALVREQVSE